MTFDAHRFGTSTRMPVVNIKRKMKIDFSSLQRARALIRAFFLWIYWMRWEEWFGLSNRSVFFPDSLSSRPCRLRLRGFLISADPFNFDCMLDCHSKCLSACEAHLSVAAANLKLSKHRAVRVEKKRNRNKTKCPQLLISLTRFLRSLHNMKIEAKKNYTLKPRVVLPDSYVKGKLSKLSDRFASIECVIVNELPSTARCVALGFGMFQFDRKKSVYMGWREPALILNIRSWPAMSVRMK